MKHLVTFESFVETLNEELVLEGGAAGHMAHVYEDYELTFTELKEIIGRALEGTLDKETDVVEKLDGQAISVSWKGGKLVAARNKGHLKNAGEAALDVEGIVDKFSGRGDLSDAFAFAVQDLERAIGRIKSSDRENIFEEGKKFMAVEVLFPPTVNVISYDAPRLVFHGTLEYDDRGNSIGEDKSSASRLARLIRKVNADIQHHFKISPPVFLKVPKHQDFEAHEIRLFKKVDKLAGEFSLKTTDTVADYHYLWWNRFVRKQLSVMKYPDAPDAEVDKLIRRFAFKDKSLSMRDIRKVFARKDFVDWVSDFEKNYLKDQLKDNHRPFEMIFLELGVTVLKNMSGFLAANPDEAVQRIRDDVNRTLADVKKMDDVQLMRKLKGHLDKVEELGGFQSILPTEGLVFVYKNRTYKLTGSFAPSNQIIGMLKYAR